MELVPFFAIFGAVGGLGGLAAILTVLFSRRKLRAEGDTFVVQAAESLTSIAMRQLARLEKDVQDLTRQVAEYRFQMEDAVRREALLGADLKKLRARVAVLERFITAQGLVAPE